MTADPNKTPEHTPPAHELLQNMQQIGDNLIAGMEMDNRVQSGVPAGRTAGDLDFIQMSGLTRPGMSGAEARMDAPPVSSAGPLSFYEQGVADVDSALAPPNCEGVDDNSPAIATEAPSATPRAERPQDNYSIDDLKQIIEELSHEANTWAPSSGAGPGPTPADNENAGETPSFEQRMHDEETAEDMSDSAESILISKTDSLAELLERELASELQSAEEADQAPADHSPLIEPVQDSPETPAMEPPDAERDLEHEDFGRVFDDLMSEPPVPVTPAAAAARAATDADESPYSHDLAEVEQLLKTLQEQPREALGVSGGAGFPRWSPRGPWWIVRPEATTRTSP